VIIIFCSYSPYDHNDKGATAPGVKHIGAHSEEPRDGSVGGIVAFMAKSCNLYWEKTKTIPVIIFIYF
jgi:hypothetical protein